MPWWFVKIFWALAVCFLFGLLLGLVFWRSSRRREAEEGDKRRLELEAETDRLRLRLTSLKASADKVKALEHDLAVAQRQAARVPELEGELAKVQGRAATVPRLQDRIVDLRDRAGAAERLESEIALLRSKAELAESLQTEVVDLRTKAARADDLETTVASLKARSAQAESLDADLRNGTAGVANLAAEVAERDAMIDSLKADIERLDNRLNQADSGNGASTEKRAPVREWRHGTTEIGTPGASHRDDLKVIKGIGPVLERTLNELGIKTWEQLAALSDKEVAMMDEVVSFPGRMKRDGWVAQAESLVGRFPLTEPYHRPTKAALADSSAIDDLWTR